MQNHSHTKCLFLGMPCSVCAPFAPSFGQLASCRYKLYPIAFARTATTYYIPWASKYPNSRHLPKPTITIPDMDSSDTLYIRKGVLWTLRDTARAHERALSTQVLQAVFKVHSRKLHCIYFGCCPRKSKYLTEDHLEKTRVTVMIAIAVTISIILYVPTSAYDDLGTWAGLEFAKGPSDHLLSPRKGCRSISPINPQPLICRHGCFCRLGVFFVSVVIIRDYYFGV